MSALKAAALVLVGMLQLPGGPRGEHPLYRRLGPWLAGGLLAALLTGCSSAARAPEPTPLPVAAASELTLELPWALLVAAAQALGVPTEEWPDGAPAVLRLAASANPPPAPAATPPDDDGVPWWALALRVAAGLLLVGATAAAAALWWAARNPTRVAALPVVGTPATPDLPPAARARAGLDSPRASAVPGRPGGRTSPEPEIDP